MFLLKHLMIEMVFCLVYSFYLNDIPGVLVGILGVLVVVLGVFVIWLVSLLKAAPFVFSENTPSQYYI